LIASSEIWRSPDSSPPKKGAKGVHTVMQVRRWLLPSIQSCKYGVGFCRRLVRAS
jgi:hypothetical protein